MEIDMNENSWATPCPKYDCKKTACKCGLEYVNIPTSLGDDSEGSNVAPKNGAYCNALVVYEANNHVYIYSKEGVPTLIDVDASDISTLEQEVIKAQKDIHEFREDIDRFAYFFDTVADMKASDQLQSGDYARTLGYYSKNDGGGAYYKISSAQPSGYYENLGGLLCAELIVGDYVNVDQIGAHGDGESNDTSIVQYAINNFGTIYFSQKTYICKGLTIPSDKTLVGNKTVLKGDNSTDGIKLYNSGNTQISKVNMENFTIENYTNGIFAINVVESVFRNVTVKDCSYGARFAGSSYTDYFYGCRFNYCNNDGFNVGFTVTHPLTSATIAPNIATMDFYSCGFYGNNGYGVNGWMRAFNFFGGYSENNSLGAVCLSSKDEKSCDDNSFIGFDIEDEDYAYVLEAETDDTLLRVTNLNVIGGQIALRDYDGSMQAIIYMKGRPTLNYTYNIKFDGRLSDSISTTPERYHIYSTSTQNKSVQAEVLVGNQNNSNLKTNMTLIIPNNLYRTKDYDLPLTLFGKYYNVNDDTVTLPANEACVITLPSLKHLTSVTVKTDANMNLRLNIAGTPLTDFRGTGVATGYNVTEYTFVYGNAANTLIFRNMYPSQSTTITNIKLTALLAK